jgi:thioester reductase-like protein
MPFKAVDIRKETVLNKNWNLKGTRKQDYKGGVLVTGANSFIGCHVVSRLRQQFSGEIHLLLRAPSYPEAVAKMQKSFVQWGLGDFDPESYVFHFGDVCSNQMGLSAGEYKTLGKEISQVVHLAMTPMYNLPYEHFQRIWLPELERMISFCGDPESPKFLHYTSSFNANFFRDEEDFGALNTNAWQSGYAGFKWVANMALGKAMNQGLGACIYDVPLVLGSEKNGICPGHYSIWLILDIFLKTGMYFPFSFKIIPVDVFADIVVFNVLKVRKGNPVSFCRPLLSENIDDQLFAKTAANLLGLQEAGLETVRSACRNKLRFDFMMPENFYFLMKKVNELPAVFPEDYDLTSLPITPMVFMSNLNRIMSSVYHQSNKP